MATESNRTKETKPQHRETVNQQWRRGASLRAIAERTNQTEAETRDAFENGR